MSIFHFLFTIAIVSIQKNSLGTVHALPRFLYDRHTNDTIEHTWLEVGFAYLDDIEWLSITTKNDQFQNNVVAFVSLPDFGGSLYNESVPLVPKLQQLPQKNEDNTWTFVTKLIQARGSYCSTEWYTPVPIEPVQISWIVVEERMLEMAVMNDDMEFMYYQTLLVGSSNITRNNSDADLTDGSTDANGNFKRVWFPVGCDGDDEVSCTLTDFAPRSSSLFPNYASIQQLQTSVNGIPGDNPSDVGIDLFLSVRCKLIASRHLQLVMSPHSSFDPILYEIDTPEIVAYFIFPTPFGMTCSEGMVIETHVYKTVTSVAIGVPFDFQYDYPPGLFGMLGSAVSVVDSTTLRTFGRTNSSAHFITQEDQCTDEESIHTTQEWAFTLLVGESHVHTSQVECHVRFSSAVTSQPSSTPTLPPTKPPTTLPSVAPTALPTVVPTSVPSNGPTKEPTISPTSEPSTVPTIAPTVSPSAVPTSAPSFSPSTTPTITPTSLPSLFPTVIPTAVPTISPSSRTCPGEKGPLTVALLRNITVDATADSRRLQNFEDTNSDRGFLMCTKLAGHRDARGNLDIRIEGSFVTYSFFMTTVLGDWHDDYVISVHFVGDDAVPFHTLDLASLRYSVRGDDNNYSEELKLYVEMVDFTFETTRRNIEGLLNGQVHVVIATKVHPQGEVFGVPRVVTKTGYGVLEVNFPSKGIIDLHIDGNRLSYSMKLTNFTRPIRDIVLRHSNQQSSFFGSVDYLVFSDALAVDGMYSVSITSKMLLSDESVDSIMSTDFVVEVITFDIASTESSVEAIGKPFLAHVETKSDDFSMEATLNSDKISQIGQMSFVVNGNKVLFSFEKGDALIDLDEDSEVSFHFTEYHDTFIEIHEIYKSLLKDIHHHDDHYYFMMADDGIINLFATDVVSVILNLSKPSPIQLVGPVLLA